LENEEFLFLIIVEIMKAPRKNMDPIKHGVTKTLFAGTPEHDIRPEDLIK